MKRTLIALLCPFLAHAEPQELLQELFVSQTVYAQERLELQVTSGFSMEALGGGLSLELPLSIELGLTDRFQVEVEGFGGLVQAAPDNIVGAGNPSFGLLYSALPLSERGAALSLSVEGSLASLTDGIGEDAASLEAAVIGYKDFGPVALNAQLAGELARGGEVEVAAALGLIVVAGRLRPTLEALLSISEEPSLVLAPGLISPLGPLELGVGLPVDVLAGELSVALLVIWERDLIQDDE